MKASLTAAFAALESAAIALALFALVGVPAFLTWWVTFSLEAEPAAVLTGVAAGWALSHGVPLSFSITAETALQLGIVAAPFSFVTSLIPLGVTALAVFFAIRMGLRFADRGGVGVSGVLGGAAGYACAAWCNAVLARPFLEGSLFVATLLPTLVYLVSSGVGFLWGAIANSELWWEQLTRKCLRAVSRVSQRFASGLPGFATETVRVTLALTVGVLGLGAVMFAGSLLVGYVDIVTLSQGLQLSAFGVLALFGLQLVFLPVAVIWSVAWLSGVGIGAGVGSLYSPFAVQANPLPPLPLFGALPSDWGWAAACAPALIVGVSVGVGVALADGAAFKRFGWIAATCIPILGALATGGVWAALSALATGAVGPGQLSWFGIETWPFWLILSGEIALGALLGVWGRRASVLFGGGGTQPSLSRSQSAEPAEQPGGQGELIPTPASPESPLRRTSIRTRLQHLVRPRAGVVSPDNNPPRNESNTAIQDAKPAAPTELPTTPEPFGWGVAAVQTVSPDETSEHPTVEIHQGDVTAARKLAEKWRNRGRSN